MHQNPNLLATIARINQLTLQSATPNFNPYFLQQQLQTLELHLQWQYQYYEWIYSYIENCRTATVVSPDNLALKRSQLSTIMSNPKILLSEKAQAAFYLGREILLIRILLWFEFESEFKQELLSYYQSLIMRVQSATEYSKEALLDLIDVAFPAKEFGLLELCRNHGICFGPNLKIENMINRAIRHGDIPLVSILKDLQAEPPVLVEDESDVSETTEATPTPIPTPEPEIIVTVATVAIIEKPPTPIPMPKLELELELELEPQQLLSNALKAADDKAYNNLIRTNSFADDIISKELLAFISNTGKRATPSKKLKKPQQVEFEKNSNFLRKINIPIRTCCILLFSAKTHDHFKKALLSKLPSYSDNDLRLFDAMFNFAATADDLDVADAKLNKKIASYKADIDRSLTALYYAFANFAEDLELIELVTRVYTARMDGNLIKFGHREPGNFFHVLFAHKSIAVISAALTTVFKVDTAHTLTCALLDKYNGISPLAMIEAMIDAGVPITTMLHKRLIEMAGTVAKNKPENLTSTLPNAYIDVFDLHNSHNLIVKLYQAGNFAHLATVIQQRHDLRDTLQDLSLAGVQKLGRKFEAQASELVQVNSLHISLVFGMDEYLATRFDGLDLTNMLLLSVYKKQLRESELAFLFNSIAFRKAIKKYSLLNSIYWYEVVTLMIEDPNGLLPTALQNLQAHIAKYELDVDKEDSDGQTILIDSISRGSMPAIRFVCEKLNPGLNTGVFAAAINKFHTHPEILEYFAPLYYSHTHEKDLLITLAGIMNNIPVIDWTLAYLKQHGLQCIISAGSFASILIHNTHDNCLALEYLLKIYNAMCIADRSLRPLNDMLDSEQNSLLYTASCVQANPHKFSLLIKHGCVLDERFTTHKMNIPLFLLLNVRQGRFDLHVGIELLNVCLDSNAVRDCTLRYSDIDDVGLLEYTVGCALVVVSKPELEAPLIDLIQKILSLNPPVTRANTRNQNTLMHICTYVNNVRILEPVLKYLKDTRDDASFKALINAQNKDGHTPLDLAVLMDTSGQKPADNPAVKLLEQAGAKFNTLAQAQTKAPGLFFESTGDGSLRQVSKKNRKLKL